MGNICLKRKSLGNIWSDEEGDPLMGKLEVKNKKYSTHFQDQRVYEIKRIDDSGLQSTLLPQALQDVK